MSVLSRVLLAGLLVLVVGPARAASGPFAEAMTLLSEELVGEAVPLVEELERREPDSVDTRLLRARLLYMQGRYQDAVDAIERAREAGAIPRQWRGFEEQVRSTLQVVRGFKAVPTSRGNFVLHVPPGVDEVLIPYADQAMEAAWDAYGDLFGYRPSEPVRIEVYPRVEDLAAVSTLSVEDIQNSGTIALCKYNRLMITSPRDLLYGYDWLDTLAHEYIHFVITKRSRNRVPIWLQEGLAKFFENRWREKGDARLETSSEDLLARNLAKGRLITFEEMSPSMAKLPTQEDAALAFAEVFMAMRYIHQSVGPQGINTMIDVMRDGGSDREAIERVMDTSFSRFQADWRKYLGQAGLRTMPAAWSPKLYFRNKDKSGDELEEIGAEKARRHTYLGDRLRAMERHGAAVKEYAKAIDVVGESPIVAAKLAAALNALGRWTDALDALAPVLKAEPDYVLIWLHLGKARLNTGDAAGAAEAFEAAVRLNPFDPDAHVGLANAYEKLGRTEDAARERAQVALLAQ
ncbi:MAG: hypothetical protein AMXMBFR64_28740 [Myxococcales bacterium]